MLSIKLQTKPLILLQIEPGKKRVFITNMLEKSYDICLAENEIMLDKTFDLCIVSPKELARTKDKLLSLKETEEGGFVPILLTGDRQELTRISDETRKYIDDVIVEPIKEIELHCRVENLLRSRRLSLQLQQRTEELRECKKHWQQEKNARQHTEAILLESDAKLNTIVSHSTDGLLVVDMGGRIRFANPAAIALFHRPDLVGQELGVPIVGEETARISTFTNNGVVTKGEMKLARAEWEGESVYIVSARDVTERWHAELALRQGEEQFRLLVESVKDYALILLDREGCVSSWNVGSQNLLGYSPSEIIGQYFGCFYSTNEEDKGDLPWQNLQLAIQQEQFEADSLLVPQDGREFWANCKISSLYDELGKRRGFVLAIRDISRTRESEQERSLLIASLQKSQERFRNLVETTSDLIWETNELLEYTYISPQISTYLGYAPQEVLGKTRFEFMPAKEALRMRSFFERWLLQPQSFIKLENKHLHKDGGLVILESSAVPVFDEEGKFLGYRGIDRDISDRKRAEEEIREMSATLQNAVEGISRLDTRGRYISVNKAYASMTGYEIEEIVGMKWQDIVHPSDRRKMIAMYQKMLETGKEEAEAMGIRKDGSIFYQQVVTIKACDRNQNSIGHYRFMKDITERKHAELELQQAKEAAEVANRAKSEFLANMSHELRTPLNGILGYTQIVIKQPGLTQEQYEMMTIIQHCGEHLLTLINDILDLSKIEAERMELCLGEFDLPNFIKSIADIFLIRAQQKNILFNYEPVSPVPQWVAADEKRLRQILINLLSNAIKFTDKGEVNLKVGTVTESGDWLGDSQELLPEKSLDISSLPQAKIRFQVEDSGIGIEDKELTKIFLPFHQVDTSLHSVEGTGLGLSITQKLVKMMGGEIHVKSTVGEGSVFWVDLELPEISCPNRLSLPGSGERQIIGFKGKKRKVLVADDQSVNRKILTHLLVPLGFQLLEAVDGRDCLEKAAEFQPDLILMDLVMPVMDGFEATRRLRDVPLLQEVVVVALSASVFDATQQESLGAGCNSFIPKPIQVKQLLERLRLHLGLEWIYDNYPGQQGATGGSGGSVFNSSFTVENSELIPPPREEMAVLFKLAMSGDIGGIMEASTNLKNLDAKYGPFAELVRHKAKGFQIKQIREFLQKYMVDS